MISVKLREDILVKRNPIEKNNSLSINSKAFNLFMENKNLVDVAITLNTDAHEVLDLHTDYLRLSNKNKLMSIYFEMGDEIHLIEHIYRVEFAWVV